MADKNFKTLTDTDGKRYKFNAEAFKEFYLLKQREYKAQGKTEQRLRSDLGKNLGVSPDAIRGWKYGYNGPSDLSLIRKSADFLGTDYLNMVQRDGQEDDMNTNVNAAERTTEAEVVNISRQNTTMTSKEEALYGLYTTAINFIDRLSYYFVFSIDWENGSYMNAMIIQAADKIKDDKNVKGLVKEISDNISNFSDRESVMDTFKAMSTCTEEFQEAYDEILSYGVKAPIHIVRKVSNLIEHLYAEIMFRGSIFSDEDIGSNIFDKVNETDDESGDPYPGNGYERLALAYRRECSNRLFDIFEEAAQASTSERSEEHAYSMENC